MHPSPVKMSLNYGLFRLLAHEYLFELSLHSCSSSRFSTIYSKSPIPTDFEIVCEMGVIVCEIGKSCARWVVATNWNLSFQVQIIFAGYMSMIDHFYKTVFKI